MNTSAVQLVPLRHSDSPHAVSDRIQLAPEQMQIRELLKNAIENAVLAPKGQSRDVVFRPVEWPLPDGSTVAKLAIANSGLGMSPDILVRVTDLAQSGDEKPRTGNIQFDNYGVGAKVTGLKANPAGMRYRSCHDGRVFEVMLKREAGVYVRVRWEVEPGVWSEARDVTDEYEGQPLAHDWTEVVLCGCHEAQDTVADPYNTGTSDKGWLARAINQRFHAFNDVSVRLAPGSTALQGDEQLRGRELRGLRGVTASTYMQRTESLTVSPGVRVLYGVLHERSGGGALVRYGYTPHIALVWRGEVYDFKGGADWSFMSPRFGVIYGASRVVIHVLLDDAYPVFPDQYRQMLQSASRTEVVMCSTFFRQVAGNRPDWFVRWLSEQEPKEPSNANLVTRLRRLVRELELRDYKFITDDDGDIDIAEPDEHGDGERGMSGDKRLPGTRERGSESRGRVGSSKNTPLPPLPRFEDLGTERSNEPCSQRWGQIETRSRTITLNRQYPGLDRIFKHVKQYYAHIENQAEVAELVEKQVKEELSVRAVTFLLLAEQHRVDRCWSEAQLEAALTREALTVWLDDWRPVVNNAKNVLARKFGGA